MDTFTQNSHVESDQSTFEYLAKVTFIGGLTRRLVTVIRYKNAVTAINGW